jgi:hypothetical protein
MQFSVQILPREFCMINIDVIITVNATLIFTQLKVTFIINIGMNVQKKVQKFYEKENIRYFLKFLSLRLPKS